MQKWLHCKHLSRLKINRVDEQNESVGTAQMKNKKTHNTYLQLLIITRVLSLSLIFICSSISTNELKKV